MDSDIYIKKVQDILRDEVNSLEEYITYQEEKNKKLQDSLNNISKYIDEDKRIIDAARNVIKEHGFGSDSKIDEKEIDEDLNVVYSKMEILHLQLCNLTKKCANIYFPQADECSATKMGNQEWISDESTSSAVTDSLTNKKSTTTSSVEKSTKKKSLLEILKELLYDLDPNCVNEEYGVANVDDSVRFSDIEFLLSAGIVKWSSSNPKHIGLINRFKF